MASEFLKKKVAERQKAIDETWGSTQYGGSQYGIREEYGKEVADVYDTASKYGANISPRDISQAIDRYRATPHAPETKPSVAASSIHQSRLARTTEPTQRLGAFEGNDAYAFSNSFKRKQQQKQQAEAKSAPARNLREMVYGKSVRDILSPEQTPGVQKSAPMITATDTTVKQGRTPITQDDAAENEIYKGWDRWIELANLERPLTDSERKEADKGKWLLYKTSSFNLGLSFNGTKEQRIEAERRQQLYNLLNIKTSGFGSVLTGFINSIVPIGNAVDRGITKENAEYEQWLGEHYDDSGLAKAMKNTRVFEQSAQANPLASAAGSAGGDVLMLGNIGKGVQSATNATKLGKLATSSAPKIQRVGRIVKGGVDSGLTFGAKRTLDALGDWQTKEEFERAEQRKAQQSAASGGTYTPQEYNPWNQLGNVLRRGGTAAAGGSAGGIAGGVIGETGAALLSKTGLQTPFFEGVRQALSGFGFAGADMATTYQLTPEEERPSGEDIAQNLATAFIFSVITGSINSANMTRANKAYLDGAVKQMKADYSKASDASLSPQQRLQALDSVAEYNNNIRGAVKQNYYAGQQKYIDNILRAVDAVDEQVGLVRAGLASKIGSGSTAAQAATPSNYSSQGLVQAGNAALALPESNVPETYAAAGAAANVGADHTPEIQKNIGKYKEATNQISDAQSPRLDTRNISDATSIGSSRAPSDATNLPQVYDDEKSFGLSDASATSATKTNSISPKMLAEAKRRIASYAKAAGRNVEWYNDTNKPDKANMNGFYEDGTIYLNENAENPFMEVYKHELYHSLPDSNKRIVIDYFKDNINQDTKAFQEYKERTMQAHRQTNLEFSEDDFWEEYTAQNAEFLLDENFIDNMNQTPEGKGILQKILDWIRQAIARIKDVFRSPNDYNASVATHESALASGMSDAQLQKAQRLYERALSNSPRSDVNTASGALPRYSIETFPDGKRYVQADRQVITGDDPKAWAKQVERYINDEIRQGKDVQIYTDDGDIVSITDKTAWKMADRHAGSMRPANEREYLSDADYRTKAKAAGHIDELLAVSRKAGGTEPDRQGKHGEFAENGWQSRVGYFMDGDGQYYRMRISTAQNKDGSAAYNIGQIQKRNRPGRGDNSLKGSSAQNGGARAKSVSSEAALPLSGPKAGRDSVYGGASSFNASIPRSADTVNTSMHSSNASDSKQSLKRSKFYDSVQSAESMDEQTKQTAQKQEDQFYYRQISNDETMKQAVKAVENDLAGEAVKFLSFKDKRAGLSDISKGFVLLKKYQDSGDYDSAIEIAKKLSTIGTESGRQVQIYSVLGRMTPEGMLRYATSELENVKKLAEKSKGKLWMKMHEKEFDLTGNEAKWITQTMERVANMPDGRDRDVMLAEIQKLLQSKMPSGNLGVKVAALQRISLLLNPKTVISRNALSNAMMNPIYAVSDFVGSGVDKLAAKSTGIRTTAAPNYKDQAQGWKKGVYESFDDFRRRINTRDVNANNFKIGNAPAFKGSNPLSKSIAFLDRLTGYLLDTGDRPFFEGYFLESLNGQMKANKTAEPTAEMLDIATQVALEKTWQDDNIVTQSANMVRKGLNFGKDFGLGSIIVPFVKTPSNIAKAIVDFSPVGFVKGVTADAYKFYKAVKNGTITARQQKKFVDTIGKGITGIIMYLAGFALAAARITVGSDNEKDKDVRNYKRNILGITQNSIKIGDKTYSYDWAQPIGGILTTTADIYNNKIDMSNAAEIITQALSIGGNTLFEQSMLQGISEFFGSYDGFVSSLVRAVIESPSQFTPTIGKQFAEVFDPVARTTAGDNMYETAKNKTLSRIPGATKTLEPVVDVLGRDVMRYGGDNNWFNIFLNPTNVNVAHPTAETKEVWRLYEQTGNKEVFPRVAPSSFSDSGVKYTLTAKEKTQFQRVMGQKTATGMEELMQSTAYKTATDKEKASMVKMVIDSAYNEAKYQAVTGRGTSASDRLIKAVNKK